LGRRPFGIGGWHVHFVASEFSDRTKKKALYNSNQVLGEDHRSQQIVGEVGGKTQGKPNSWQTSVGGNKFFFQELHNST
jgi:hypothetical protein